LGARIVRNVDVVVIAIRASLVSVGIDILGYGRLSAFVDAKALDGLLCGPQRGRMLLLSIGDSEPRQEEYCECCPESDMARRPSQHVWDDKALFRGSLSQGITSNRGAPDGWQRAGLCRLLLRLSVEQTLIVYIREWLMSYRVVYLL